MVGVGASRDAIIVMENPFGTSQVAGATVLT
jgi:hypothetical protein